MMWDDEDQSQRDETLRHAVDGSFWVIDALTFALLGGLFYAFLWWVAR